MPLPKPLRWILYAMAGLIALILVVLAVITLVKIPIDLSGQKALVEEIASNAIGRKVSIDDSIRVTTSLWPEFTMEGLRIGNPEGFESADFAKMESTRLQVKIVPLLLGKVHVKDFSVNGLHLYLRVNPEKSVNWTFGKSALKAAAESKKDPKEPLQMPPTIATDTLVVKKINLNRISVSYLDTEMTSPAEFKISKCIGSALVGEPMQLRMEGSFLKEPFTTMFKAASLEELIEQNKSWVAVETDIANAVIKLSGSVDLSRITDTLRLSASVEGRHLESFNRMLQLDLPPIPSYGAKATLTLLNNRAELSDLKISIGQSRLNGKLTAVDEGGRSGIDIDLSAPLIQINDFSFEDWSPFQESSNGPETAGSPETPKKDIGEKGSMPVPGEPLVVETGTDLFSPDFLGRFDAHFRVSAEKVLSGEDHLGSGQMVVIIKEGRVKIDPLKLQVPGGSLLFALSVKPGLKTSDASVRIETRNFDFGFLARRVEPETDMGGTISLDVDLTSSAKDLAGLLANGNGYFDFSAQPENLKAGILDLWAINLITAVVAGSDKDQSQIECLVGRWSMADGLLKPDAFVIDTSRMRICGKGWVDFKKEAVSLQVAPVPKKPEFFSLATPLGVQGKFSDFELGIAPGGIAGTAVRFIVSPINVPIQTLTGRALPQDGSDVCGMPLGPDNRPTSPLTGCLKF